MTEPLQIVADDTTAVATISADSSSWGEIVSASFSFCSMLGAQPHMLVGHPSAGLLPSPLDEVEGGVLAGIACVGLDQIALASDIDMG